MSKKDTTTQQQNDWFAGKSAQAPAALLARQFHSSEFKFILESYKAKFSILEFLFHLPTEFRQLLSSGISVNETYELISMYIDEGSFPVSRHSFRRALGRFKQLVGLPSARHTRRKDWRYITETHGQKTSSFDGQQQRKKVSSLKKIREDTHYSVRILEATSSTSLHLADKKDTSQQVTTTSSSSIMQQTQRKSAFAGARYNSKLTQLGTSNPFGGKSPEDLLIERVQNK